MQYALKLMMTAALSLAISPLVFGQVYKVSVNGPSIQGTGEYNPLTAPGVVTFSAEVNRVSYCGKRVPQSVFNLVVANQPGATPQPLGFSGIALAEGETLAEAPGIGCRYPVNTVGFSGCLFEFINFAGPHPRVEYGSVRLTAGFTGVDFTSMPEGEPTRGAAAPSAAFAIYAANDCADPKYAGVGLAFDPVHPDDGGTSTIRRTSANTWEISVNQQVALVQWAFDWKTITLKGGKTSQSCSAYMSPAHAWTTPVQFTMTVTRIK